MLRKFRNWFKWDEWKGDLKGNPTMRIKHLFTLRGWRWSLHKFVGKDEIGCYHSHPAIAYRIILWGWYKEIVIDEDEEGRHTIKDILRWRCGMWGKVTPDYIHGIFEVGRHTYSLWIRGPKTHKVRLVGEGWPQ